MTTPLEFGRGAIVADPAAAPHPTVAVITESVVADPAETVALLHHHWLTRTPVSVVLQIDPARIRDPQGVTVEPHTLNHDFEPWLDRLHFLIWANNVDMRGEEPVWWWTRKALRLGATACETGDGDIVLPGGRVAWIDGGPRDNRLATGRSVVHSESIERGTLAQMPSPSTPHSVLAPDQLAAVVHDAGPARIIAPAGSGKTRVLTERLRHLINDRGYEIDSVLALAYNRRAQNEMQQRTADVGSRIQTLNSCGYEVVREVRPGVSMLDEREMRALLESVLPKLKWRANTDPLAAYIEALATIRLGMRDPVDVEASRDDVPGLAEAFGPYRQAMRSRNAIDFDEQIYGAVEALLRDGNLRRRWQQRNRHLLVDEFQDLRPLHLLFIRLLAAPQLDVFGVGDDDQVVYGYDGASPRFLIDFAKYFPGAAEHALTVNYRSPVAVIDAARTLLEHNRVRVAKQIQAGPQAELASTGLGLRLHGESDAVTEIIATIQDWQAAGAKPSRMAVLARVNSTLLVPQVVLTEAGIPVDTAVGPDLLTRTGTRAALAYLRIGSAGERVSSSDIGEILRRPSRGLPPWFTERLHRRRSWSLKALVQQQVPEKERTKLDRLVADLRMVQRSSANGTTLDVLRLIRGEIGLGGAMASLGRNGGTDRSSHLDDLDALERIAPLHPQPSTFEGWLSDVLAKPRDADGVTLATVHRVKGMEWDHVCLIGATEGLMPHRLSDDIEEERRIFHVAITRARRSATVLADAERPSRFLREMREAWTPEATVVRPAVPAGGPTGGEGADAALRQWRGERARADGVPAYVVLHDTTLLAIAQRAPANLRELSRIPGIGPAKLDRYGDEILAVVGAEG